MPSASFSIVAALFECELKKRILTMLQKLCSLNELLTKEREREGGRERAG